MSKPKRPDPQPIKAIAWARGTTQQTFSLACGIAYQQVHDTFNGKRPPSEEFIEKAVAYFDLGADQLFRPRNDR